MDPGEVRPFFAAIEAAFGGHLDEPELAAELAIFEPDRALVATEGDTIVGGVGAASLTVSVPGGELPLAGITDVGVLPTHRRRGILTSLIRRQMDDLRDRGEPLAGLWASEGAIYGRFGYSPAAPSAQHTIQRARSAFAVPVPRTGTIRLMDKERALGVMPAPFEAARRERPGMMARSPAWWAESFADLESRRDGGTALIFAVHEAEGVDGYAAYRIVHRWDHGASHNLERVFELVAANDAAYADLWRYCMDIDLVETIDAPLRPVDDPLPHLLADQRALETRIRDSLWLRPLDVAAALAGRRYAVEGTLMLEVADDFCPWNGGTYLLEAGPDGSTCKRGNGSVHLSLSVADLGAVYLGGTRPSVLARAGRIREHTAGALTLADAMFGWHRAPWCPNHF